MSGGGARGKGAMVAAAPVPAGSRKLVQGLKEIVNLTEAEIYAAPRECGMDADEAVSRLVSQVQGPFLYLINKQSCPSGTCEGAHCYHLKTRRSPPHSSRCPSVKQHINKGPLLHH
ncbi:uncharacterized protein [Miscanthus floridulus]|uniref:uncharacterized protein n=1 Tax=Miscanthus floridulus TaxID=154761 RepID=UPI0034581375